MGARTSNFENFYFLIEIHCTSMYISLLPQNQLLCQQVAMITMQLDHIAIHIPSLCRIEGLLGWEPGSWFTHTKFRSIERGLGWDSGPRTSKISTFL